MKGSWRTNLQQTSSLSKFLVTSCLEEASTWFGISEKKIKSQVFFRARLFLLVFPHHAFRIALLLCVTLSSIGEDAHGQVYNMSVIHA